MKRALIFFSGLAFLVMAIRFSLEDHAIPAWQLASLWLVGLFYTLKPIVSFLVFSARDKIHLRERVWAYEAELMRHNIEVPTVPGGVNNGYYR